jgi:protein-L-isoaspartate(D-aspartate) O-methyltransferase
VNAGVTHPLDGWLRALAENGRIILPLTVAMNSQIGKGLLVLAARLAGDASFDARVLGFVAIYNAVGLRDDAVAKQLGAALARNPFPPLKHLRRDSHEAGASCWMHGSGWCLSTE